VSIVTGLHCLYFTDNLTVLDNAECEIEGKSILAVSRADEND
jgi:hypothetical protein